MSARSGALVASLYSIEAAHSPRRRPCARYDRDAYDRLLNGGGSADADGLDPIGTSGVDPMRYAEERAYLERLFNQDGFF